MDNINYQAFVVVTGALAKLVIIATLLERGLSFIFEHEWFGRLTTKEMPDPNDNTKTIRDSIFPGLKGLIALLGSYLICYKHDFNVLTVIFNPLPKTPPPVDPLGVFLTSLIVAGGSADDLVFQGYLNLSKPGKRLGHRWAKSSG